MKIKIIFLKKKRKGDRILHYTLQQAPETFFLFLCAFVTKIHQGPYVFLNDPFWVQIVKDRVRLQ